MERRLEAEAELVSRGLLLGAGRAVITPPVGTELSGFIARTAPMSGIHDELYARALVWRERAGAGVAALVTLDVVELDAASVAAIRERAEALTGIPAGRIGVTCTHTHGGPATLEGRWLGRPHRGYLETLRAAAAGAVALAAGRLEPVAVTWAVGQEATVGRNRRVPGGPIDPDVPVLRFQRHDSTVAALLVSYACHPVTLGPDNTLATGDYPGYVVRALEAVYPGALVLFATGCCGQINTGHTARDGLLGRGMNWRTFGEAERLGRTVAGAALQATEAAARTDAALAAEPHAIAPLAVRVARRAVPLPLLPVTPADQLAAQVAAWRAQWERGQAAGASPAELASLRVFLEWAAALEAGTLPSEIVAEVMAIGLGEATLVLLPGESFVEFGLSIKERAAPGPVITLAYANGAPGYIPHRSAYAVGGYEVEDAYRYYGAPAAFAPEAGEAVVAAALAALEEIGRDQEAL